MKRDSAQNMKREKKGLDRRDKELILGNVVIWGTIITALIAVISLASVNAVDVDLLGGSPSGVSSAGNSVTSADG
jgi:hypothetical protein